jgi:hypothetical protein
MVVQLRGPFEKFLDSSYSKKRPSPHLHKVPTRSNKVRTRFIIVIIIIIIIIIILQTLQSLNRFILW